MPYPPRTIVRPVPCTSQANPTRGPNTTVSTSRPEIGTLLSRPCHVSPLSSVSDAFGLYCDGSNTAMPKSLRAYQGPRYDRRSPASIVHRGFTFQLSCTKPSSTLYPM